MTPLLILEQLTDTTGASIWVRDGPVQGHDLLTERQLDGHGTVSWLFGFRLGRYWGLQSCSRLFEEKWHQFVNDFGVDVIAGTYGWSEVAMYFWLTSAPAGFESDESIKNDQVTRSFLCF